MRSFLIINGETIHIKQYNDSKEAYDFAINYMDHSKEVSVIEVKSIHQLVKLFAHKEIIVEALNDYRNWFPDEDNETDAIKQKQINKAIEFFEKL